jgi:hypothetical protein
MALASADAIVLRLVKKIPELGRLEGRVALPVVHLVHVKGG